MQTRSPGHQVRFFRDEEYPQRQIADYLAAGLADGGVAVAFATTPHLCGIFSELSVRGADVDAVLASGELLFVDAERVSRALLDAGACARGVFENLVVAPLRAAVARRGSVRAYGEVVDLVSCPSDHGCALELEQWCHELLLESPIDLLCGYSLRSFPDAASVEAFREICAQHERVESAAAPVVETSHVVAELELSLFALERESERRQKIELESNRLRRRHQILADASARIYEAKLALEQIVECVAGEALRGQFAECCVVHLSNDAGSPALAAHKCVNPGVCAAVEHSLGAPGGAHVVVASLRASGAVIGTLSVSRGPSLASFDAEDRQLLQELADRAALAIENALLFQQVRRERARAESANRAKDEFLAMLGHELRNPLAPILTAVELMRLRGGDLLERERNVIERQVHHMARLVDDLLNVSRITRGLVELKLEPLELARAVADAIEIASPLLEERSQALTTRVASSGLMVKADAARLTQLLSNLLINAAKYTPVGGQIEISARANDGSVALSVKDNGVGISPELLPNIFDLFVQGSQEIDRSQGGLGLGLAIARRLAEMQGGRLTAHSEGSGRGAELVLELPLLAIDTAAGQARKVLVVDDNVDAAGVLADALATVGFVVRTANDGPAALAVAAEFRPDVALLDIGLPVMDGYELGRRLALSYGCEAPKLVAITGYGQESDARRSREAGFVEHLVKPLDFTRLQRVIGSLFRNA